MVGLPVKLENKVLTKNWIGVHGVAQSRKLGVLRIFLNEVIPSTVLMANRAVLQSWK